MIAEMWGVYSLLWDTVYIYIYIRAVNFNALTHVINLKILTRYYFFNAN